MVTRAKRDYYEVLGVPRDADRELVKKAFRTLAAEIHPDVSSDPDAGEKFREIAEAYEVLSHAPTRERYDRFGYRGSGLFDDLLGAHGAAPPRPGERGADVLVEASLDFVEAARGTTRGVRYRAVTECAACGGSGGSAGSQRSTCAGCSGSGRIREDGSAARGRFIRFQECARCRGRGTVIDHPCPACGGHGRAEEERSILVEVPAGTEDGDEIRLEGEGHAGGRGGPAGDVIVRLCVRPAPDSPLLRHLAAVGALCGVGLVVVTLILH